MAPFSQNRLRQLQGLVTIDAWHEGVPSEGSVELFAYVNFDEARLGGNTGDEIAFKMLLKRAELRLLQSEPKSFSINTAKIWRGDEESPGKTTYSLEEKRSRSSNSSASLAIGSSPDLKLGHGITNNADQHARLETTSDQIPSRMQVSFRRADKDQPSWDIKPGPGAPSLNDIPFLSGQPWVGNDTRLLLMYVNTKHQEQEMTSALRLCIICRSEDLHFYDITVRGDHGRFYPVEETSPKRVVIQEYLRSALIREGLPAPDMDSPFSPIYLGEAVSEPHSLNHD